MSSFPRFPGGRMRWSSYVTPAIRNIVIVCAGVFVVQELFILFFPPSYTGVFNHVFGLVPWLVTHRGFIWQPFTYIFMHGGLLHLLFNMLFLWMFGVDIERAWGTKRFYTYFFLTGI